MKKWKETLKTLVPNPPLSEKELKVFNEKLNAPTVRSGPKKAVVPIKFTEREEAQLMWVELEKLREENRKKFGGGAVQKNWTKMSKAERAEEMQKSRLKRGEGTTGSRPMNV